MENSFEIHLTWDSKRVDYIKWGFESRLKLVGLGAAYASYYIKKGKIEFTEKNRQKKKIHYINS